MFKHADVTSPWVKHGSRCSPYFSVVWEWSAKRSTWWLAPHVPVYGYLTGVCRPYMWCFEWWSNLRIRRANSLQSLFHSLGIGEGGMDKGRVNGLGERNSNMSGLVLLMELRFEMRVSYKSGQSIIGSLRIDELHGNPLLLKSLEWCLMILPFPWIITSEFKPWSLEQWIFPDQFPNLFSSFNIKT